MQGRNHSSKKEEEPGHRALQMVPIEVEAPPEMLQGFSSGTRRRNPGKEGSDSEACRGHDRAHWKGTGG